MEHLAGRNKLPAILNSLSHAALAGRAVFSSTKIFCIAGNKCSSFTDVTVLLLKKLFNIESAFPIF